MYPLHSIWMAEQAMDGPYDPDRLDRVPVYLRPVPVSDTNQGSRVAAAAGRIRSRVDTWIRRSSLGPVPNRCAGDPAGHGW